jgi:hypothetical protein
VTLTALAVVLAGCDDDGEDPECDTEDPCPTGQDCIDGRCVASDGDGDGDLDADGDSDGDADGDQEIDPTLPPASEDWTRDILATSLEIDLATRHGVATITLAPSESTGASFDVKGLVIDAVGDGSRPFHFIVADGRLDVGIPTGHEPAVIVVEYVYSIQPLFEGAMDNGATLTWPYHCGNLFPCHSDPSDGVRFELGLTGVPEGRQAVYPETIPADAPSYMLAWSVAEYEVLDLGTTAAGTHLVVWHRPGQETDAGLGAADLVEVFDWYERTLGAYVFGPEAGTVSVDWGLMAAGGMEHHPFWHLSGNVLGNPEIHAHEAAHGWFGNGVRIACWEDFVLSEGTVTYLTALAIGAAAGEDAEAAVWTSYQDRLDLVMTRPYPKIAWPDSCGEIDIIEDHYFSDIPYMKGAFFFRALEGRVGREELLLALAAFYEDHVGRVAGMQDLLDAIAASTGYDPTACADAWLHQEDVPDEDICP